MGKVLDVSQAKLCTTAVEVQVIRIDNKQMTLAVFRQLVSKPLVDFEALQLRGVLWGWVNHHERECPSKDHLHLIWQDGNRLYKDTALRDNLDAERPIRQKLEPLVQLWFATACLEGDRRALAMLDRIGWRLVNPDPLRSSNIMPLLATCLENLALPDADLLVAETAYRL